jgi:putative spermidine/putrescine transport system ATP-binding protein
LLGRAGTWSVRPEKIGVTGPADDPPPDTTTAVGIVDEIVYTGATTRCLVALEAPDLTGAARLTVLLVNDGHSRRAPERGEAVRLFWRPEHEVPVA